MLSPAGVLAKYSRDLTSLAREGKLDPVVGRHGEMRRLIDVLGRRTKNRCGGGAHGGLDSICGPLDAAHEAAVTEKDMLLQGLRRLVCCHATWSAAAASLHNLPNTVW
jgi:hypothetical protein